MEVHGLKRKYMEAHNFIDSLDWIIKHINHMNNNNSKNLGHLIISSSTTLAEHTLFMNDFWTLRKSHKDTRILILPSMVGFQEIYINKIKIFHQFGVFVEGREEELYRYKSWSGLHSFSLHIQISTSTRTRIRVLIPQGQGLGPILCSRPEIIKLKETKSSYTSRWSQHNPWRIQQLFKSEESQLMLIYKSLFYYFLKSPR